MTFFEYIAVAVSIVLSLSVAQILSVLREVFDPARRDWLHASWVLIMLLTHVVAWWDFWSYRDVDWSLPAFILVLGVASLVYICTQALVVRAPGVEDYRSHLEAERVPFFLFFALLVAGSVVRDRVLRDDFNLLYRGPESALILMSLIAAQTSSRNVHLFLNGAIWLLVLLTVGFLWAQPGGAG